METIKNLTNNPAILELTDIIEARLEREIAIAVMPQERRKKAPCSIIKDGRENGFTLLYTPKHIQDIFLCHELSHVILCIEGFPGIRMPVYWKNLEPWYSEMVDYAFQTALHLEVWPMGEQLGFSESERFDDDIKNKLIPDIEYFELANHQPDNKTIVRTFYHLLAALLSPAPEATKSQLLQMSERAMPTVLAPVLELCKRCRGILPLNAETFFDVSEMFFAPLNVHQYGGVLPDYPVSPSDPDFRKFVLKNYSYRCLWHSM